LEYGPLPLNTEDYGPLLRGGDESSEINPNAEHPKYFNTLQ
jgi:hypothetical protein